MKFFLKSLSFAYFTIIGFDCVASSIALEKMHEKIDQAKSQKEAIPLKSIIKKGNVGLSNHQDKLQLDIVEENGVRIIKGIKKEGCPLDKLFWSKQLDLVDMLAENKVQGLAQLMKLISSRCIIKNINPLLTFVHELAIEDNILDDFRQVASESELKEVAAHRKTFDSLLLFIFNYFSEGMDCLL